MKKIFATTILAAAMLGLSCSKWTEPEALDFPHPQPGQENPQEYAAYLKSLRQYKLSSHKVMMVDFTATGKAPSQQREHITSLPDSVDYICVSSPENMTSLLVSEMKEVQSKKGTQALAVVDYMAIQNDWDAMIADLTDNGADNIPGDAEFQVYCRERTKEMIESCDKFGFAGIVVAYKGQSSSPGQETFFNEVRTWRQKHRKSIMVMHGYIQNIADDFRTLISDSRYIVLWTSSYNTGGGLTTYVAGRLAADVPSDRFVIESAYPALDNPTQVGASAEVAAEWTLTEDARFTKAGLYISNARDDYFNIERIYPTIRNAIQTMNPAKGE